MFSFASSTVLALALASASAHSISHVRRHHVPRATPPEGWATGYLEVYDVYHARYIAIGCENKHNTSFFNFCCHPLLATETVEANRPACCAVGATAACPGASSSAVAVPKTTAAPPAPATTAPADDNDDDDDCDDDEDGDDEDNGDDGDEEECDGDDGDESSTVESTHAAVTTSTPKVTLAAPKMTTSAKPAPAPTTSTTPKPAPTTSTTAKATPTTTAATSTKTSSASSFILGGFGTWFTQNGVAGACGTVHKDTDFVVALQTAKYANGANCGRKIQIINLANGKSATAVVADECPTCTNQECVDMSVSLFESLSTLSTGEIDIKWQYLD
jgi:hypothetical protein